MLAMLGSLGSHLWELVRQHSSELIQQRVLFPSVAAGFAAVFLQESWG